MPVFKKPEPPKFELLPEGDYKLTVFEFATELSSGKATSGSTKHTIVFNVEGSDIKLQDVLIDNPKTDWKINAFVFASGIRNIPEDQDFDFEQDKADERGVPWINPMGLRCHARVEHEEFVSNKSGKTLKSAKVKTYLCDPDLPVLPPDPELRNKLTAVALQKKKDSGVPF